MPWDQQKCSKGYPREFTNDDAAKLVRLALAKEPYYFATTTTKAAFRHVQFGKFTLCVVDHIHPTETGLRPGNSYIPGWENWAIPTPPGLVPTIDALPESMGEFPGANRYPH